MYIPFPSARQLVPPSFREVIQQNSENKSPNTYQNHLQKGTEQHTNKNNQHKNFVLQSEHIVYCLLLIRDGIYSLNKSRYISRKYIVHHLQ